MADPDPGIPAGCPEPDLAAARKAVDLARSVVDATARRLASSGVADGAGAGGAAVAAVAAGAGGAGEVDEEQVVAYDMAHAAAAVRTAEAATRLRRLGGTEACLACAFTADMMAELASRTVGREELWGLAPDWIGPGGGIRGRVASAATLAALAGHEGRRMLDPDFELVRETFRRFAVEKVRPNAEHVHRTNSDIPEEIIAGLGELGGFGLSVPEEYGGLRNGIRERLPGDGDRHRGALVGIARDRWLSHHPARDPLPGARARRHRGSEARLAPEARIRRGDGRGSGDRARLRLGRREHRDVSDAGRPADG